MNNIEVLDWSSGETSVADLVLKTANEFVDNFLPGYVYLSEYELYFNEESGYYYQPKTELYYHPITDCYYRYDVNTQQYESIKCQNSAKWAHKRNKKRANELFGNEFTQIFEQEAVDIIEVVFDLVDRVAFFSGDYYDRKGPCSVSYHDFPDEYSAFPPYQYQIKDAVYQSESDSDVDIINSNTERRYHEEEVSKQASCIRVVQVQRRQGHYSAAAQNEFISALSIITILGAHIIFDNGITMIIPTEHQTQQLSQEDIIFSITYDDLNGGSYKVLVENAFEHFSLEASLNDHQLKVGQSFYLSHGDAMRIGDENLCFHIHKGNNTCAECEPGQFACEKESDNSLPPIKRAKMSKEVERKIQNNLMKAHYGISDLVNEWKRSDYVDRAEQRRTRVGSEPIQAKHISEVVHPDGGIYSHCQAIAIPSASNNLPTPKSSISQNNAEITDDNKGYELLKKMGWNSGQGLGKDNQGISTPIEQDLKTDRSGLGSEQFKKATKIQEPITGSANRIRLHFMEKTKLMYRENCKDKNDN